MKLFDRGKMEVWLEIWIMRMRIVGLKIGNVIWIMKMHIAGFAMRFTLYVMPKSKYKTLLMDLIYILKTKVADDIDQKCDFTRDIKRTSALINELKDLLDRLDFENMEKES